MNSNNIDHQVEGGSTEVQNCSIIRRFWNNFRLSDFEYHLVSQTVVQRWSVSRIEREIKDVLGHILLSKIESIDIPRKRFHELTLRNPSAIILRYREEGPTVKIPQSLPLDCCGTSYSTNISTRKSSETG